MFILEDFNLTKVHNGDLLTFEFLNAEGNPVDFFTKACKVSLTSTTMKLKDAYSLEGKL